MFLPAKSPRGYEPVVEAERRSESAVRRPSLDLELPALDHEPLEPKSISLGNEPELSEDDEEVGPSHSGSSQQYAPLETQSHDTDLEVEDEYEETVEDQTCQSDEYYEEEIIEEECNDDENSNLVEIADVADTSVDDLVKASQMVAGSSDEDIVPQAPGDRRQRGDPDGAKGGDDDYSCATKNLDDVSLGPM
jgi:hypothetical protein